MPNKSSFLWKAKREGGNHGGRRFGGGTRPNGVSTKTEDARIEMGRMYEPYGRFDTDIKRFCCRICGYQAEKCAGLEAHLYTEHMDCK